MKYFILCGLLAGYQFSSGQLVSKQHVPLQPYLKYVIRDNTGNDSITFYLSEFSPASTLPLLVYIQGSGSSSLFSKDKSGRISPVSGHITWAYEAKDKAKLLIIEKPGVNYLVHEGEKSDFDRRFSLENWAGRIEQVIRFVINNERINTAKIMVAGHSEGGLVAARVARDMDDLISNVAVLAGEGPSQLYSLYSFAESGIFFDAPGFTREQRVDSLTRAWKTILSDPNSVKKKFWGFTYLRWSSFLRTSVSEELGSYTGKVIILQGDEDKNVAPESARVLYTMLLSKGKDVMLEVIPGADHSFSMNTQAAINGWELIARKTIRWFLGR